jgi:hypothetical protein
VDHCWLEPAIRLDGCTNQNSNQFIQDLPAEIPLAQIDTLLPGLNLVNIVTKLSPPEHLVQNVTIGSPAYAKQLSALLAQTPPEVLQGYFMWKAVVQLAPEVIAPELEPWKEFVESISEPVRFLAPLPPSLSLSLSLGISVLASLRMIKLTYFSGLESSLAKMCNTR